MIGLAISHTVSFVLNYRRRGEYLKVSPAQQAQAPYGRLVILHLAIILGAGRASFSLPAPQQVTDALRIAMLLQMVLPGAPCIYYGDEIGMEGRHDPDNRRGYPPDPGARDQDLRAFVRAAIAARRANPALRSGSVRVVAADGGAVAILREGGGQRSVLAFNAGDESAMLAVRLDANAARWTAIPLPGSSAFVPLSEAGVVRFDVEARSGAVYLLD